MPYVDHEGLRIHYQETGKGIPLVLQHGFFSSIEDWYMYGYVEKLSFLCRLIMIDARGHGKSDKPHQHEAYKLRHFASDIVAVLDHLGIEKANYLGYSMGGWIGYGLAKYAPTRLDRLIIGGAHPYGRKFSGARQILELGIDAWISEISGWGPYTPEDLERFRQNDAQALLAVLQDRTDISDILPEMTMPCLFYAGESDREYDLIKGLVNHVENASFFSLPGLNHIETLINGQVVADQILKFLTSDD